MAEQALVGSRHYRKPPQGRVAAQGSCCQHLPRWRHINHPTSGEADLPVMYAAVPLDSDGRVLAIGRSAVMMADMQQRLLQAQQSMERNYLEIRHLETRYRLLFQVSSESGFILSMPIA